MRRYGIVSGVLVAAVLLAGTAQAISQGPGGRLYLAGMTTSGPTTTKLYSIVLDQNWNIVGGGGGGGAGQIYHGTITDTWAGYSQQKETAGCSPELETYAGSGYGKIVMGAYYNNSPGSTTGQQTLDVLRITPDGTPGLSIQSLGDGRARAGDDCHTDGGLWAVPDPKGLYTGGAGRYSIQVNDGGTGTWDYNHQLVVRDTNGDGDVTDDPNDYLAVLHSEAGLYGQKKDQEIYGERMYTKQYGSGNTVYYYKNTGGTITRTQFGPTLSWMTYEVGLAAGEVKDQAGKSHQATWTVDYVGDSDPWIVLLADWDDDGDALDAGEYHPIYGVSDANVSPYDDPNYYTGDLELVKNADGKLFLLVSRNDSPTGGLIYVLELDDNGDYSLGFSGIHAIMATADGYVFPNDWGESEIEFDSNLNVPIPEPTTMLLVGTGVLGVLGYIRRRRMN